MQSSWSCASDERSDVVRLCESRKATNYQLMCIVVLIGSRTGSEQG